MNIAVKGKTFILAALTIFEKLRLNADKTKNHMTYNIKQQDKFKFIEEGSGEPLLLLHGLFGALSNFEHLVEHFKDRYKVVVPLLPLFELDIFHTTVGGLEK